MDLTPDHWLKEVPSKHTLLHKLRQQKTDHFSSNLDKKGSLTLTASAKATNSTCCSSLGKSDYGKHPQTKPEPKAN